MRWLLYPADRDSVRSHPAAARDPSVVAALHRQGRVNACLARELQLSRQTVHTLRQRIQINLNDNAPTEPMNGQTFEVDEVYQNAGEKKYAASRSD